MKKKGQKQKKRGLYYQGVRNGIFEENTDWDYSMRREMQGGEYVENFLRILIAKEIIPGLYLGPYAAAMKSKFNLLKSEGITHIVCIRQAVEAHFIRPNFPEHFRYLVLDISDNPAENIIHHFRQTKQFIDACLSQGGKVLVHGNGGICRSGAVVIAYIMVTLCLSCSQAMRVVRNRRFCVFLNEGFLQQLMEYEHIYKAESQFQSPFSTSTSGVSNLKRKRESEMEVDPLLDSSF